MTFNRKSLKEESSKKYNSKIKSRSRGFIIYIIFENEEILEDHFAEEKLIEQKDSQIAFVLPVQL